MKVISPYFTALLIIIFSFSNSFSQTSNETMHRAIQSGAYLVASKALDEGANPNYVYSYSVKNSKSTPQMKSPFAIFFLPVLVLDALLPAGSTTYYENSFHDLLMDTSQSEPYYQLVTKMVEKGADLNSVSNTYLPLDIALRKADMRLVKLLTEAGADPFKSNGSYSPFTFSMAMGNNSFYEYFLFNPDLLEKNKETIQYSLRESFMAGELTICRKLLEMGIEPVIDYEGKNFLHLYADADRTQFSKFYLDTINAWIDRLQVAGVDINGKDNQGRTPLMEAAISGNYLYYTLINHGADIHLADNQGKTALHYAVIHQHYSLLNALVKQGADIYAKDSSRKKPGDYLGATWSLDLINQLQADIDPVRIRTLLLWKELLQPSTDGVAGTDSAISYIKQGVYLDSLIPEKYVSSLSFPPVNLVSHAVLSRNYQVLKALLEAGGNPNFEDPNWHHVPLAEAVDNKDTLAAWILLKYGADPSDPDVSSKMNFYRGYTDDCDYWVDICEIVHFIDRELASGKYFDWVPYSGGYMLQNRSKKDLLDAPAEAYMPFNANGFSYYKQGGKWGVLGKGAISVYAPHFDTIYSDIVLQNTWLDGKRIQKKTYFLVLYQGRKIVINETFLSNKIENIETFSFVFRGKDGNDYPVVLHTDGLYRLYDAHFYPQYIKKETSFSDYKVEKGKLKVLIGDKWKKALD